VIDHVWSVICSHAILDKESNNFSLIDEQINIQPDTPLPLVMTNPFIIVTLWSRSNYDVPATGRGRISVEHPSGTVRELAPFEIDLSRYRRYRNRHGFRGFQITELGKYVFRVELFDPANEDRPVVVARLPLDVRYNNPEHPD
jgi:hypothetical protein